MREFETSGPCDPALHYTVMREALIAEGMEKVAKGRYFTIFAPRQAGKTTYFRLLLEELKKKDIIPIQISFENLKTVNKEIFYKALDRRLEEQFAEHGIIPEIRIANPFDLEQYFGVIRDKPVVLVIDEFEGIPDCVLSEVMHTFRYLYHKKDRPLHSLILVGVSTLAELVVSSASPFNISEDLQIPYFTSEEVRELISQYVSESGQVFEEDAIKAICENTKGQPGLVCGLCQYLVEKLVRDKNVPITVAHYYRTQRHFLTERFDKNIINIVQKARDKKNFMLKLLFEEESLPFSIHDPDMAWLYANGVIDKDNGNTDILVPLYKKALITAFRPMLNGETRHYITSPRDTLEKYLTPDGGLNINALLNEYAAYIRRRGFRAFDPENPKEAACHYSLDGFINFFITRLGGETYLEVPTGKGRTDILILHEGRSHIIEIKVYTDDVYFTRGRFQLAEYLKSERLSEGYYVVFSGTHTEKDDLYSEEIIEGKMIFTHIILTNFPQPSRLSGSNDPKPKD